MSEQDRPPLLVAKGSFKAMGGAEMDLIRVLPAMNLSLIHISEPTRPY